MVQPRGATASEATRVRFHGRGAACSASGEPVGCVEVDLVGGSGRYTAGGSLTEAMRWWRGELTWISTEPELPCGSEVWIVLEDGRAGVAVIEPAPAAEEGTVVVRGIGPPPFDVP